MLLWIKDAPLIGRDSPEKVLSWIQARICCSIPDAKSCPELHRLVTRYQLRRFTEYCKSKCKLKGQTDVFIIRCRFDRQPRGVAQLNPVEECLKVQKQDLPTQ